ncbi:glutamate ABC transporter substrate-binding protein [Streptomyces sp. MBT56]|uniref:glutamate ABC transporter substrate-binding protein n=1 Tax=unclassified Streptomyces TaxID=2593676 RepID=UPI001909659E|nr:MULTISPECIES: glutamate ABC transporter substrate-binding protein [unclassified Streptomyces]MBK3558985.1 glutamate ABC transporter substrate-binding protein [Streptomyces sp. MBT56]MBK3602047.1 glutamate ABC transporter substrate-binding protein [Streptomyces sp. MBT54]MBK3614224.1 glutamate ABC transporter substrate-binding protein [Streptomyces sp. MBT98]MBK6045063.1 glutamate ABC transporter substrate-binding protein [Streptomyces sp. MBT55]
MSRAKDRPGRGGLRGWGGVTGMAVACAVTAAVTLLPLAHHDGGSAGAGTSGGVVTADRTRAEACTEPEASLPASGSDGPNIDRIKERGKLIAGVDQNSFRWGYRNPESGDLEGFDIDLVRAIADDLLGDPDAVIFRAIPTNQRIAALENDRVDVVVRTMTINCKRLEQVSFSTAYFQAGQQVLAPKESPITGYDSSLKGKRVCSAEGSTAYEALEKQSFGALYKDDFDGTERDPDRLTVPNQLDCLVRLQLGEVDAVVTDNALAAGQAAQDPAVELKGKDPFTTEYYGVATKKGSDDLVARVNKVLVDYRAGGKDSAWMRSYEKWLATGLPGITAPPAPKYRTD